MTKTAIELVKARTFELDPTKKYAIVFDKRDLSMDDARKLVKEFLELGVEGVAVALSGGGVFDIVELTEGEKQDGAS